MSARAGVGRFGEDIAARYLVGLGWYILARNWRSGRSEADVIAVDGGCLVIVEVKTRRTATYGDPLDAVTPAKVGRLRQLAAAWLASTGGGAVSVRIDAIGVLIPARGAPRLDHRRGVQ